MDICGLSLSFVSQEFLASGGGQMMQPLATYVEQIA